MFGLAYSTYVTARLLPVGNAIYKAIELWKLDTKMLFAAPQLHSSNIHSALTCFSLTQPNLLHGLESESK